MTVATLLADLQARGVRFKIAGERLSYDAPQGVMKPSDLEQLRTHKLELLQYVNKDAANSDDPHGDAPGESRRQRVLAMLKESPGITYAITSDTEAEQDAVIITLAIRDKGTCELRIPKERYDGLAILQIIEAQTGKQDVKA